MRITFVLGTVLALALSAVCSSCKSLMSFWVLWQLLMFTSTGQGSVPNLIDATVESLALGLESKQFTSVDLVNVGDPTSCISSH